MWLLFVSAFGLGIVVSAPPGPIFAEAVRRGTARGFRAAFLVEAGSLIGDVLWAVIALIGIAFLVQSLPARLLLSGLGVFLLVRLGLSALRDSRSGRLAQTETDARHGDFATGALISLANPFAVAFWLGIGGSVIAAQLAPSVEPEPAHFAVFLTGYMTGVLLWMMLVCAVIGWGRRFVKPPLFRLINLICGLSLLYFGTQLAWSTLSALTA